MMPNALSYKEFKEKLTHGNRNEEFKGFSGKSAPKTILGDIFAKHSEVRRHDILDRMKKLGKFSELTLTSSSYKTLANGEASEELTWAYYYCLHRYKHQTHKLADIDRAVLASTKTLPETIGQYIDGTICGAKIPKYRNKVGRIPISTTHQIRVEFVQIEHGEDAQNFATNKAKQNIVHASKGSESSFDELFLTIAKQIIQVSGLTSKQAKYYDDRFTRLAANRAAVENFLGFERPEIGEIHLRDKKDQSDRLRGFQRLSAAGIDLLRIASTGQEALHELNAKDFNQDVEGKAALRVIFIADDRERNVSGAYAPWYRLSA